MPKELEPVGKLTKLMETSPRIHKLSNYRVVIEFAPYMDSCLKHSTSFVRFIHSVNSGI